MNPSQVPVPYVNAADSASYHNIKYPSLRQMSNYRFDKSTLRHLSKIPRVNTAPTVRIAPPEPISMNLFNDKYISNNDRYREEVKNDNYLQVLKEISRKRNYTQEETERVDSTPKKSRKNDIKNFMTSHYKRSHDDSSNDNLEDTTRKKRCSDSDRSVAKMMSYTSSMSVLTDDFSWNTRSKKRKCSKIEKSKNESPEKVEKLRKIAPEECNGDVIKRIDPRSKNSTYVVKQQISPMQDDEPIETQVVDDETDSRSVYEPPLPDDDGEYVRVASGKILNRTNCMYRKKLNSSKIDPESVISIEPELVNGSSHEDDDAMKENLLKNLIDDIERKGEKNESVIFYENSIVEEIAKNQNNKIEAAKSQAPVNSSFNPLLSQTVTSIDTEVKPTFNSAIMSTPSVQSQPAPKQLDLSVNPLLKNATTNVATNFNSAVNNSSTTFNNVSNNSLPTFHNSFNANTNNAPTLNFNSNTTPSKLTFGSIASADVVDKAEKTISPKAEQKQDISSTSNVSGSVTTSAETVPHMTTAAGSPKNNFLFPCVTSMAPSNTSFGLTTSVNSASFHTSVSSPTQNCSPAVTSNAAQPAMPTLTFGAGSSLKFDAGQSDKNSPTNKTSTPEFGNAFNSQSKPEEKSNLSQITMFGNTAMSTTTSSISTTNVSTPSTMSSFSTAGKPSGGFQFGQSTTTSGGFSFGSVTGTSNEGFKTGITSAPPAFSTSSAPTFSVSSAPSFNTTSAASFSTPTQTFGGMKFGSEAAPSFGATGSSFSATGTTTSVSPSGSTFGGTQNTFGFGNATSQPQTNSFGMTSQTQTTPSFGTSTQPQATISFGTSSQPQTTSVFGNTNTQPQATPAFGGQTTTFGNTNNMFGSGDTSVFAQNTTQFGASNTQSTPQFGANSQSTSQFGANTQPTQQFGNTNAQSTPQFGATNAQPTSQFGSTGTFTFGSNTTNPPPAFGNTSTAPTPFGNTAANQPAFNSASTFNFNNGSSSFGGGAVFGAPAPAKPADNAFTFGSAAPVNQPAQNSMFQFGGSAPAQSNQPFTFAAGSGSATGGGFSIGAGGSSRSRATRNRRK